MEGGIWGCRSGGRKLEEVNEFKCLGMLVEGKGGTESEIKNRVVQGMKVFGALETYGRKEKFRKK